jgi:hypothetical protein
LNFTWRAASNFCIYQAAIQARACEFAPEIPFYAMSRIRSNRGRNNAPSAIPPNDRRNPRRALSWRHQSIRVGQTARVRLRRPRKPPSIPYRVFGRKDEKSLEGSLSFLFHFVHAREDEPRTVLEYGKATSTRDELEME